MQEELRFVEVVEDNIHFVFSDQVAKLVADFAGENKNPVIVL